MPGQVEGDQAVVGGETRIGHQAMELAAIGAGGVEAEQVTAGAGGLVIYAIRRAARDDRDVGAGDGGPAGWRVQPGVGDGWGRQSVAKREPAADVQHAARDVAVLHEG